MDEWDDYGEPSRRPIEEAGTPWEEYGEPSRQQVEPIAPLPFGQRSEMSRQKLINAIGETEDKFYGGQINQETFDDVLGQINRQLVPLEKRRVSQQANAQQSMTQQALGETAMNDAVVFARQNHAAQVFPKTMHRELDPLTGTESVFYQSEPGKWTQAKTEAPAAPAGQDYAPAPGPNPYRDQEGALLGTPGEAAARKQAADEINRQRAPQQSEDQIWGLAPGTVGRLQQQAFALSNGDPRLVRSLMPRLISGEVTLQHQQRAIAYKEQKEAEQVHADKWFTRRDKHLDRLISNWEKRNTEGEGVNKKPAAMSDEVVEQINKQADLLADRDYSAAFGEDRLPAPRKAARQPKGETAPQPKEVKPVQGSNESGKRLDKINRKIAELEAQEAAKSATVPIGPDPDPQTGFRSFSKFR